MDTSKEYPNLTNEGRTLGNKARWKDHKKTFIICVKCGKKKRVYPKDKKPGKMNFCSQKCANFIKGVLSSKEKHMKQNGYIYIKNWNHPNRTKQNLVAEHRLIVEKEIDRYLTEIEIVHHVDEDKHNNVPSNLYLCRNRLEHKVAHHLNPESLKMLTLARYSEWESFKDFNLLKGIQDQLQGMVHKEETSFVIVCELYTFIYHTDRVKSMEQLWLAFVMKEKFNKTWNGEEWRSK